MPRYTDIDLLIDKVYETTWYHINKNGELVTGANPGRNIPLYKHSDINRVLSEAPEADVVPKSEYDNLKMQFDALDCECDRLEKAESEKHDKFIEAKAEVAREIFAEVRTLIDEYLDGLYLTGEFMEIFDELNKKYTEGKT